MSKKLGIHTSEIGNWKHAAIENMAAIFNSKGTTDDQANAVEVEKLRAKIGQLVVKRDFLVDASHTLLKLRGKK